MEVQVIRAGRADAKHIAAVYNAGFYSDYIKYGMCPGYGKTEESILSGMESSMVYKIMADGIIVGAISVREKTPRHYYLGGLCVVPAYAGRGIGQQAMHFLDEEFPHAKHWALETPTDKTQNHFFYQKFGYRVTREYLDGDVPISYFERNCPADLL